MRSNKKRRKPLAKLKMRKSVFKKMSLKIIKKFSRVIKLLKIKMSK